MTVIAVWVQAVVTVLLVGITAWYVHLTHKIASATARQADAAQKNIEMLADQLKVEAEAGITVVDKAIESTLRIMRFWETPGLPSLIASGTLPSNIRLVPRNADDALKDAHRISIGLATQLASAFTTLEFVELKLSAFRERDRIDPSKLQLWAEGVKGELLGTKGTLEKAQELLRQRLHATRDRNPERATGENESGAGR
jgi:hypothetical protein